MSVLSYIEFRSSDIAADPDIDKYIEEAEKGVGKEYCGDQRERAVALVVMHQWALDQRAKNGGSSTPGAVESEKEGDLSRKFGKIPGMEDSPYWSQTSWGVELYNLGQTCFFFPRNRFIP